MKNRQIAFSIDNVVYGFILITTIAFTTNINYENKSPLVIITFYIIGLFSFFSIVSSKKNISIFRTAHIFNYIFLFLAPLHQYLTVGGQSLWKGNGVFLFYSDSLYLKTNLIIISGLLIFNIAYMLKTTKKGNNNDKLIKKQVKRTFSYLSNKSRITLLIVSTLSLIYLILTNNLTSSGEIIGDGKIYAQVINIVRYFPVCSTILYLIYYNSDFNVLKKDKSFLAILFEVVLIFFPFWGNMPRFLLFGTYIVLISELFTNSKNKSFYFLLFFVGFSLDFSALKHFSNLFAFLTIKMNYNHLDFDAYQLLMSIVSYTDNVKKTYGLNILSALMFLIPRSIWGNKMDATGGIVISYYGSWFKNVSAPYIGELYFAFGWLGVIIGSVVTGIIVKTIDSWNESKLFIKKGVFCILCGMTIYISRGSLLPTMAFTLGIILSLVFICYLNEVTNKLR